MEERKSNRPIFIVSMALIAVVAILVAVFLLRPASNQDGIVLPDPQQDSIPDQQPQTEAESGFLVLNTGNVVSALEALTKPQYYHQSFTVIVTAGRYTASKQADVWVNGGLIHAEIRSGTQTKSLLSDGETVWIWYDTDLQPICLTLEATVTLEDLLGLPSFDFLESLRNAEIVDASYELLEEEQRCVYVCTQNDIQVNRYWIDLDSGLLCRSDVLEDSTLVYEVNQTDFDRLAPGDQAFTGRFCLPDGTEPFTVEREMRQP